MPVESGTTQLPIQIQGSTSPGQRTRVGCLGNFPIVNCAVGYRVCVVVVVWVCVGGNGGNWSRKKIPSGFHVHRYQSLPYTPATMKRVADSQLTKDTEDGDDGREVNAWWCMRAIQNSPPLVLAGGRCWLQDGLRLRTREQEVCAPLPQRFNS